jgi:pimeloyl-ACP methyl ester carboxylesterase
MVTGGNNKTFTKKITRMMFITLTIFFSCIFIVLGVLRVLSSGKQKQFIDEAGNPLVGSLSEKVFVNIGGVTQGMFIKSKNTANPVLLYLHGGMPEYFLTQKYPTGLEDYFTVVWWEQRGSGISYSTDIPPESMTLGQMIKDVLDVTNYLRQRFGKDKIYLMGHSGGTFIGIQAASQAPEFYYGYIGVAQMSDQLKSEQLAYEYMLKYYKERENMTMVQNLEIAPVKDGTPDTYLKMRDKVMHNLGIGTTHTMNSVITGIFIPSLICPEYTLKEKINMWRGKSHSGVSSLWDDMLATNLLSKVPKLEIPVYFFGGVYDYTVSYTLAKEYYDNIQAPMKGFYTFEKSAHSPLFEEPEKMQKILCEDVLKGVNTMADSR